MELSWGRENEIQDGEPKFPYTHFLRNDGDAKTGTSATPALTTLIDALDVDLLKGRIAALVKLLGDDDVEAEHQGIRAAFTGGDGWGAAPDVEIDEVKVALQDGDAIAIVIDDGAFFAHDRLQNSNGQSRVAWAWLQDAENERRPELSSAVPFGRELFPEDIQKLIEDCGGDEDAIYRKAGLIDTARAHPQSAAARYSHGMAVADLMAGQAKGSSAADRLHVLMVGLPTPITWDTSGTYIAKFILAGLEYALARVDGMLKHVQDLDKSQVRVAVNLSYGLSAGPKDGSGIFERYLNTRLAAWRKDGGDISCFAPMGNTRLAQSHARLEATAAGSPLRWVIPPDDPTPNFLEIWSAPRKEAGSPTLGIALSSPGNAHAELVAPAAEFDKFRDLKAQPETDEDAPIARLYHSWRPPIDGVEQGREVLTIAIQPSVPSDKDTPFAPPGAWSIAVTSMDESVWPIDLFIQRDDSLPGYARRGRQSWLEDGVYQRHDASGRVRSEDPTPPGPVRRAGTYNALASGTAVKLVGGARVDSLGHPIAEAAFSSLGFLADEDGRRDGPDFIKPADGPASSPGLVGVGARSGSRVALRGTSFASPLAARETLLGPNADDGHRMVLPPF